MNGLLTPRTVPGGERVEDGLMLLEDLLAAGRAALDRDNPQKHVPSLHTLIHPIQHRIAPCLYEKHMELSVQLDEVMRGPLLEQRSLPGQQPSHC